MPDETLFFDLSLVPGHSKGSYHTDLRDYAESGELDFYFEYLEKNNCYKKNLVDIHIYFGKTIIIRR